MQENNLDILYNDLKLIDSMIYDLNASISLTNSDIIKKEQEVKNDLSNYQTNYQTKKLEFDAKKAIVDLKQTEYDNVNKNISFLQQNNEIMKTTISNITTKYLPAINDLINAKVAYDTAAVNYNTIVYNKKGVPMNIDAQIKAAQDSLSKIPDKGSGVALGLSGTIATLEGYKKTFSTAQTNLTGKQENYSKINVVDINIVKNMTLVDMRSKLTDINTNLKKTQTDLANASKQLDVEISKLAVINNDLGIETINLTKINTNLTSLKSKLDISTKELETLNDNLNALKTNLITNQLNKEQKQALIVFINKSNEFEKNKTNFNSLLSEYDTIQSKSNEATKLYNIVSADVDKLNSDLENITSNLNKEEADLEKVSSDLNQVSSKLENITSNLNKEKSDLEKVSSDLILSSAELDNTSTELKQKTSDLSVAENDVTIAFSNLTNIISESEKYLEQLRIAQENYDRSINKQNELTKFHSDKLITKDNLANSVNIIKSKYDAINNDYNDKLITKDNLANSVNLIKSKYDAINNDYNDRQQLMTNLEKSVKNNQSLIKDINNNLNSKIQLKNSKLLDVENLSIRLNNAQNSKDNANKIVIDSQLELNAAKNTLDQINEKINNSG